MAYNVSVSAVRRWLKRLDKGTLTKREIAKITAALDVRRNLANSRIKNLEKAGFLRMGYYGSNAGKTALGYAREISGKYNAKSFYKQKNIVDALEQALYVEKFLNSPQSLVSKVRTRRKAISENYQKKFESLKKYSAKEMDEFMDLMNHQAMHDFLSFFANYREAVEMMGTIFQEEGGKEFLEKVFDELQWYLQEEEKAGYIGIEGGLNVREAREAIEKRYNSRLERARK